ncbi:WD40 repeat [Dyadobacter soli]|uniref:WD40 repeat n=1 Tax=Dyadobacter soli TaxID=659014 RepID=A0A1G7PX93_9BACT|nr:caspase family protein [Dyadobacter soli]SDF90259.1 WD40 repeat [Dyadobacter soli]
MGIGTVTPPQHKTRRNRLFFVAIDKYDNWTPLQYPVSDCQRFFTVLKNFYGFSDENFVIQPLFDENAKTDIVFDEICYLADKDENGELRIRPEENLIIYFSGHGHFDKNKEGYWVPSDAPILSERPSDLKKLISVSEVIRILSNIKAHHIVLIVDACFSEAFATMEIDVTQQSQSAEAEEVPSRWVLTAGRNGVVPDKSPFADALVDILHNNADTSVSINWLGAQVTKQVRDKGFDIEPLCKSLVNQKYKLGEFFFHRAASASPAATPFDTANLQQTLRAGSKAQFERLQKGRYKYLNIESILVSEINLGKYLDVQVRTDAQVASLQLAVEALWQNKKSQALLVGDGGMGKTVSLLLLWRDLLFDENGPVPIFIPLNEYNSSSEAERNDFVVRYIYKNLLNIPEPPDETVNALWQLFETSRDGKPSLILLLDGLNEVTVPKGRLMATLNDLAARADGTQMVISSRNKQIEKLDLASESAALMQILPLTQETVVAYLKEKGQEVPANKDLLGLFSNPMMLTLYSGANNIALRFKDDDRFHFRKVTTYGELLWNFNEAQLAQLTDANDEADIRYQNFLLRVLVPYIAYRMEDRGKYAITIRKLADPVFNFKTLLDEAFAELDTEELTDIYPEFEGKRKELGLGILTELDDKEQRSGKVKQFLVERLRVLVMEGDDLRFLHQNFRDFFAVCHIRNVTQVAMVRRVLPDVFFRNYIPVYLRRLLGEIEGEHNVIPTWNAAKSRLELPVRENLLSAVMDLCRSDSGVVAGEAERAFVIRNVITIWLDLRQSLAGANLTNLDLRQIQFNGLPLTKHKGSAYLPARFEGSIVDGDGFIFNGHYGQINQVHYSADGKKLLTASDDCTIKEWLTATGKLLQTFTGHDDKVVSARYSPDGQKVVSASYDTFVKEWSVTTGAELASYEHAHSKVNNAVYSPDGTKILTCADDKLVREWRVETRECNMMYAGHTKNVASVAYSPKGDKILSASADNTVREWFVRTRECLRTLNGHTEKVNSVCYSPDGTLILSASDDRTMIEWSAESDAPFRIYKGHSDQVYSAIYSADGERILSTSKDKTMREWSVKTGLESRTYAGHTDKVNFASYSPDKPRVVSASDDKSIREWSVETGTQLYAISGQSDWVVNKCIVSPDSKKLLTVNYDRTFSEIHIASGIALQAFRGHEKWLHRARYSSDGTKIISTSDDMTIREWLVETGECIRIYRGHAYGVEDATYNADGTQITSRDFGHNFRKWSVATGECLEIISDEEQKKQLHSEMQLLTAAAVQPFNIKCRYAEITVKDSASKPVLAFINVSGLFVQGCDFRNVNPASNFSEAVRKNLRSYGAIFSDADEAAWESAKAGI